MPYDYSRLDPSGVRAQAEEALRAAEALVAGVVGSAPHPSFEATVQPLDDAEAAIVRAEGQTEFMARVHPELAVRDAGQQAELRLRAWLADLPSREEVYAAVSAFASLPDAANLDPPRRRLLDHLLRDFRRAGQDLDASARARVRALRARLVELESTFQRTIDEWDDGLELTRDELDGLSDAYVERLPAGAAPGTYRVSLAYPDYFPFVENARRRDLRERLQAMFLNRARPDNLPVLQEALAVRRELAGLLGYPSWAHYAIEIRMAGSPDRVHTFYDELVPALQVLGNADRAALAAMLAADTGETTLQSWDWRYYDTQRLLAIGVDRQAVMEYFELGHVLDGLFGLCGDVFGLTISEVDASHAWHGDVRAFEVRDRVSARLLGEFYLDLFPRPGKFGHAMAQWLALARHTPDGQEERPVSAIVANVTAPAGGRPSLLGHDEVLMLFHEFGHILHELLDETPFARFALAHLEGDFWEAPSQIMEHWVWEPAVLRRFGRHYRTGEPIPENLVDHLAAARDVDVGLKMLRQVYLGLLDLTLHEAAGPVDIESIERAAWAVTGMPYPEGTLSAASFGHVMGGYDAGYYGYLWSRVLGDDMWGRFESTGITDPAVGEAYRREVLEPGASADADVLLRRFLGREPTNETFLRLLGIASASGRRS